MKFSKSCLAGLSLANLTLARPAELTSQANFRASAQQVASVGYATMNGGTSGGKGGSVVNVDSLAELERACAGTAPAIIMVSGKISTPGRIRVGSNKSIIGKSSKAELAGVGLYIRNSKNVIVRNVKIHHVLASNGDAITIQASKNVWVDHVEVWSDKEHGKDHYDGLIDVTHASDFVTISNSHIHHHYKASLVGHSDKNSAEDTGKLHVTYANNYWQNINSRAPSLRFGTAHIFDSLFVNVSNGINVRRGAQVLVENDAFTGSVKPLYTVDSTGSAVENGNDFGEASNTTQIKVGTFSQVPYDYTLLPVDEVKTTLPQTAGTTLTF